MDTLDDGDSALLSRQSNNSCYWPAIDSFFTLKARPQLCSDQLLSLTGRTELLLEATPVFEAASWVFFFSVYPRPAEDLKCYLSSRFGGALSRSASL